VLLGGSASSVDELERLAMLLVERWSKGLHCAGPIRYRDDKAVGIGVKKNLASLVRMGLRVFDVVVAFNGLAPELREALGRYK